MNKSTKKKTTVNKTNWIMFTMLLIVVLLILYILSCYLPKEKFTTQPPSSLPPNFVPTLIPLQLGEMGKGLESKINIPISILTMNGQLSLKKNDSNLFEIQISPLDNTNIQQWKLKMVDGNKYLFEHIQFPGTFIKWNGNGKPVVETLKESQGINPSFFWEIIPDNQSKYLIKHSSTQQFLFGDLSFRPTCSPNENICFWAIGNIEIPSGKTEPKILDTFSYFIISQRNQNLWANIKKPFTKGRKITHLSLKPIQSSSYNIASKWRFEFPDKQNLSLVKIIVDNNFLYIGQDKFGNAILNTNSTNTLRIKNDPSNSSLWYILSLDGKRYLNANMKFALTPFSWKIVKAS